jgi:hypothetical protein
VKGPIAAVLFVLAAAACQRAAAPPRKAKPPAAASAAPEAKFGSDADVDIDADNLLNLAYGASVVSRTGESNLEYSAMQAIDGYSGTYWSSPPGGPRQTLVFALPSRARIDRLGVTGFLETPPGKIRFDASLDGKQWREVATQNPEASNAPQIADVKPFEARYLRLETIEPRATYEMFRSVHAIGAELARPQPRNFGDCWTINGVTTQIVQDGARITGVMASTPPTFLEGGTDGRVAMLMWRRAPNWGYATVTMDADTRTLSGLTMYQEIATANAAAAWFGKPCAATPATLPPIPPPALSPRWSMYGVAFDARDQLLEDVSRSTLDTAAEILRTTPGRFRITSHELRVDAAENRTAARIASLRAALQKRGIDLTRIDFVAAGNRWSDPPIVAAIQRLLASRVDLEKVMH